MKTRKPRIDWDTKFKFILSDMIKEFERLSGKVESESILFIEKDFKYKLNQNFNWDKYLKGEI